jgi:cytochrome c peroxidase
MSPAKVELGRRLFYDRRLSVTGDYACATCHRQELAFTDGRATAVGATGEAHPRAAMSLVNVAYASVLTWSDPGATSLEEQVRKPLLGLQPLEMGARQAPLLAYLRSDRDYRRRFRSAFPGERDPVTLANLTRAVASFERSIISARSPYDRYYFGGQADAIPESAKRGEALFFTDGVAGCYRCHGGFNFSDAVTYQAGPEQPAAFHNTALYAGELGQFKAPTLRNIALTAPYMHDGSVATLEEVLDHYAAGGRAHANPAKDARMTGFPLTPQNRLDLLAFLDSLTDRDLIADPRFSDPLIQSR